MQLSDAPSKLVLAFSADGSRNVIPVAPNPTPGLASYADGFPPLTRTPLAAGGIPPAGLDMNGVLYESSAVVRWMNAGGTFKFDDDFASDSNVGGYPAGALLLQSNAAGVWMNLQDDQTLDPDNVDAAQFGWVPGIRYGVTTITLASSNVTLAPNEYASPIIILTGTLTTNVQVIFPAIACQWVVINNTAGDYIVTCKTASGSGIQATGNRLLLSDGTDILMAATDVVATSLDVCAHASGTADALEGLFQNLLPASYMDGMPFYIRAASANTITTPTVTFNSGLLTPKTIVKGSDMPLVAGDIAGDGHWLLLQYDSGLDKVVLMNPASGFSGGISVGSSGKTRNLGITCTGSSSFSVSYSGVVYYNGSVSYNSYEINGVSAMLKTNGAWSSGMSHGSLDTGTITANRWYYVYAITNGSSSHDFLISLSSTSPTLPVGYPYYALIGAIKTEAASTNFIGSVQKGIDYQYAQMSSENIIASGTAGNINTPTWTTLTPVSNSGAICPIATKANIFVGNSATSGGTIAAPNNSYGGIGDSSGNQPPLISDGGGSAAKGVCGEIVLESNSIYYAASSSQSVCSVRGMTFGGI